jgi:hypothetical protein
MCITLFILQRNNKKIEIYSSFTHPHNINQINKKYIMELLNQLLNQLQNLE